jgi:hypothetical protein
MFWERQSRIERKEILFEIQKTLCNHHRIHTGPDVHPQADFLAPDHFGPFLPVRVVSTSQNQPSAQ